MGAEEPSLTVLFGDDVYQDIQAVAAETGLPVSAVENAVRTFAPQLLGEDAAAAAPAKGETFGNVFKAITEGISQAAPNIAAAVKGNQGTPAATAAPAFDPMSLLIPGAIAAALLFLIMKK